MTGYLPLPWTCPRADCGARLTFDQVQRHERMHRAAHARAVRTRRAIENLPTDAEIAKRHIKRDEWGRAIECENPLCRRLLTKPRGLVGRPPSFCSQGCRDLVRHALRRAERYSEDLNHA